VLAGLCFLGARRLVSAGRHGARGTFEEMDSQQEGDRF
jgi:hypothetical protein